MNERPFLAQVKTERGWFYATLQLADGALHVFPEFKVPKVSWSSVLLGGGLAQAAAAWVSMGFSPPAVPTISTYSADGVGPISLIMAPLFLAGSLAMWFRERRSEKQAIEELAGGSYGELALRLEANAASRSFPLHEVDVVRRGRRLVLRSGLGDRLALKGLTAAQLSTLLQALDAPDPSPPAELLELVGTSAEVAGPTRAPAGEDHVRTRPIPRQAQ
ncbi:MAG: hypothetical protein KDA24_15630 [Deltaproteobacteria bacterium]|nr:hypothetical protein [Deltaproteobacteria bacterium]